MTCKVGQEPEGGSEKRKEVGNDNSLVSMFAKQQAVSVLNKVSSDNTWSDLLSFYKSCRYLEP